ncbi:hypothetical protein RFI_06971 [Reticulomyxa filosa]|uniref:EF-hand domain-containing protein n=1 Tax=Reticulomyxa filosa TaxID=46433 RepID=X6NV12_RETFI|nr:hypothetical protein RFI_06971 [Reticulomyxa filosa]|eukprot:ETO30150.1 hypothetical protein RFI_06971 [Reticulomyxa filosa]
MQPNKKQSDQEPQKIQDNVSGNSSRPRGQPLPLLKKKTTILNEQSLRRQSVLASLPKLEDLFDSSKTKIHVEKGVVILQNMDEDPTADSSGLAQNQTKPVNTQSESTASSTGINQEKKPAKDVPLATDRFGAKEIGEEWKKGLANNLSKNVTGSSNPSVNSEIENTQVSVANNRLDPQNGASSENVSLDVSETQRQITELCLDDGDLNGSVPNHKKDGFLIQSLRNGLISRYHDCMLLFEKVDAENCGSINRRQWLSFMHVDNKKVRVNKNQIKLAMQEFDAVDCDGSMSIDRLEFAIFFFCTIGTKNGRFPKQFIILIVLFFLNKVKMYTNMNNTNRKEE